jgi:hypothetical protein
MGLAQWLRHEHHPPAALAVLYLRDPLRHVVKLRRHAWPGLLGQATIEAVCKSPAGTVAVTWHAPTVAEKMDTTVEELRAALETAPGTFM